MSPQEEYEREKIQWTFIAFPDNKDCIELIDRKPNGIIPTLDEQVCLVARASDCGFKFAPPFGRDSSLLYGICPSICPPRRNSRRADAATQTNTCSGRGKGMIAITLGNRASHDMHGEAHSCVCVPATAMIHCRIVRVQ